MQDIVIGTVIRSGDRHFVATGHQHVGSTDQDLWLWRSPADPSQDEHSVQLWDPFRAGSDIYVGHVADIVQQVCTVMSRSEYPDEQFEAGAFWKSHSKSYCDLLITGPHSEGGVAAARLTEGYASLMSSQAWTRTEVAFVEERIARGESKRTYSGNIATALQDACRALSPSVSMRGYAPVSGPLPDGEYILSRDVPSPLPKRLQAMRKNWMRRASWKAGLRFTAERGELRCSMYGPRDRKPLSANQRRLVTDFIQPHLRPWIPERPSEVIDLGDEADVIDHLFATGRITIADVQTAVQFLDVGRVVALGVRALAPTRLRDMETPVPVEEPEEECILLPQDANGLLGAPHPTLASALEELPKPSMASIAGTNFRGVTIYVGNVITGRGSDGKPLRLLVTGVGRPFDVLKGLNEVPVRILSGNYRYDTVHLGKTTEWEREDPSAAVDPFSID